MDCPVCNHKGIPDESRTCPNCHADLTMFRSIHKLNSDIRLKRNVIFALAFLVVLLLVFLGYMFLFSEGFSSRYTRMEIQAKNNEIIELKKQNSDLRQQLFDLKQTHGIATDSSSTGFQKVIPSGKSDQQRLDALRNSRKVNQKPDKKTKTPEESAEVTYYTIKAGETLYSVARKEYGDGKMYKKIMQDNNIDDPSDVKVGMRLKIIKK